jgi:archaellum component FlaG (FlaF/FlaG flagellin family)
MKNKSFRFFTTVRLAVLMLMIAAVPAAKANSGPAATCALADLAVGPVTITTVSGNTFQYHFEVKNVGHDTLFLNRMFFQTYVSQNGTYSAPYQAAGGSIFGTSAPALLPGQSYTAYWYYNPTTPADLTQYPYLIIDVGVAYGTMPECTLANNIISHYIGCTKAELVISSININNVSGNTFSYTFDVKNLGWDSLHLDRYFFQAYISQDDTYDPSDKPAGGSIFPNAPTLAKDEIHTQYWYYNFTTPENITQYHYVIVQILPMPGAPHPECNPADNFAVKDIGCNLAELSVGNIVINSVEGNTFQYTFDITNLGWDSLHLDRYFFQAYISQDDTYDFSDQPAGGSIFPGAPTLAKDQTLTQNWYYNFTIPENITLYHYVIVQILPMPGEPHPECNPADNFAVKDIGCNLAELTVGNVIINNIDSNTNTFDYTFDVTNLGWDTLFLDRMFFQTYLSSDSVYSAGDPGAGGSIFGTSAPALTKDQSYTQSWYYNPTTPEDLSLYPYLLIQVMVYSGKMPECNTGNNATHFLLPVEVNDTPVIIEPIEDGPFEIMYSPRGCFLIKSLKNTAFAYAIFSLEKGLTRSEKIAEGSAKDGTAEVCLSKLPPGLYVIKLTSGRSTYSYKFMVRE